MRRFGRLRLGWTPNSNRDPQRRYERYRNRVNRGMVARARCGGLVRSEHDEQVAVVNWLREAYPDCLFTASCGGMRTSIGVAKKMKKSGYTSGCPDLIIAEPRGKFHGLWVEMKRTQGGTVSASQKEWISKLLARGYQAVICRGYAAAVEAIKFYL